MIFKQHNITTGCLVSFPWLNDGRTINAGSISPSSPHLPFGLGIAFPITILDLCYPPRGRIGTVLAWHGTLLFERNVNNACLQQHCLIMKPPGRQSKPFKFFDEQLAQAEATQPEKTKKIEPRATKTIPATDPPAPEILQVEAKQPTTFSPPVQVGFKNFIVNIEERTPFTIFMKLFGWESVVAIVAATNAYAVADVAPRQQYARTWHSLSTGEFLRWLGLLFYMGSYPMKRREDHWPRFMTKIRWDQIHRMLTFNIDTTVRPTPTTAIGRHDYWWKLEPVNSIIRRNCVQAVTPPSWVSIDELMVPFCGRTADSVKMKNKPIPEGYKVWALGFEGYYYDWLYYSPVIGTEDCDGKRASRFAAYGPTKTVLLAATFQVPVRLCQKLRNRYSAQEYTVFLDNLFLNVPVAHALLYLRIGVMGTTRKNAAGFRNSLVLKNTKHH